MQNGVLIAVPIPEKHEAAAKEIQAFVDQAVAESEANGVSKRGKEATPWLLSRIAELTQGRSIESNIALLENTALIGEWALLVSIKILKFSRWPNCYRVPKAGTGGQRELTYNASYLNIIYSWLSFYHSRRNTLVMTLHIYSSRALTNQLPFTLRTQLKNP